MRNIILPAVMTAIITAAGCSDSKTQKVNLQGKWSIENIVFSDSDYVRPDEATPGIKQYITFDNSMYFIHTNCNTISGSYVLSGDSIRFNDGIMTEMACDNMAVEDAIRRILPDISAIDIQNDSVIRLNGANPAECIVLLKSASMQ